MEETSFLYSNGAITPISFPSAAVIRAMKINENGQVAGVFSTSAYATPRIGFLYKNGIATTFQLPDNYYYEVVGLNASGEIVFSNPSSAHNYLYSDGVFVQISPYARGINDNGVVIGNGYVYDHGVYTSIIPPGSISSYANAINNRGQIAGVYTDIYSNHFGFVATPVVDPVPIPAAFWLFGSALTGFCCLKRGKEHS